MWSSTLFDDVDRQDFIKIAQRAQHSPGSRYEKANHAMGDPSPGRGQRVQRTALETSSAIINKTSDVPRPEPRKPQRPPPKMPFQNLPNEEPIN